MEKRNDKNELKAKKSPKEHCTAFCPKCGSDLYYYDYECICKNKECNWSCGGCSSEK